LKKISPGVYFRENTVVKNLLEYFYKFLWSPS